VHVTGKKILSSNKNKLPLLGASMIDK